MKSFFLKSLAGLLAVSAASSAMSASEKSAIALANGLEKQQDFAAVIVTLEVYADAGNSEVEIRLANAYLNLGINEHKPGDIDNEDMRRSLDFAQRAARHGQASAFNLLYQFYGNGWGVPIDNGKALDYLKRGVHGGDSAAKLNYAIQLYQGSPLVGKDLSAACKMFKELSRDDKVQSMSSYYIGQMRYRGQCGFKPDRQAGMQLVEIAAQHGMRSAERDMGKSSEFGWTGRIDLHKALVWYQQAADHGDPESSWRIGMAYVNGELGSKDSVKGVQYLQQSADSNYSKGLVDLGVMYATGDGVVKDFDKARSLYEKAAELGEPHAFRELAAMYASGEGVHVDRVRARVMYLQSVEMGEEDVGSVRKMIEAKLTAVQVKESDQQFEAWRQKHAGK